MYKTQIHTEGVNHGIFTEAANLSFIGRGAEQSEPS